MEMKSRMPEDWLAQAHANNPCQKTETGNWLTCPVRLSFPFIFKPQKARNAGDKEKFKAALLFWSKADVMPLYNACVEEARREFPQCFSPTGEFIGGVHLPFRNQSEKAAKLDGYVPGAWFIQPSSEQQPQVWDVNRQIIMDPARVYPGAWVIAVLNTFTYRQQVRSGVGLGLNGLMVIADDNKLGGGAGATQADFAKVNIQAPTNFNAGAMFNTGQPQQPGMPGMGAPQNPGQAPQQTPPGGYPSWITG